MLVFYKTSSNIMKRILIMLLSVKFSNFYSFNTEQTISFEAGKAVPESDLFVPINNEGDKVTKIMAVVGPNAAGKTNFFKLLYFIRTFIIDSSKFSHPLFIPFCYDSEKNTDIEVVIDIGDIEYKYTVSIKDIKVQKELLKYKLKADGHIKTLLNRSYISANEVNIGECEEKGKYVTLLNSAKIKSNTSLLSAFPDINNPKIEKFITYWNNFYSDMNFNLGFPMSTTEFPTDMELAKRMRENEIIRKEAIKILKELDFGLDNIEFEKHSFKNNNDFYIMLGIHIVNNKKIGFVWNTESAGTQTLFRLLEKILTAFKTGGLVVLDELDTNLHPDLLEYIVDMFANSEMNVKNAQLIFSSHSHLILNKLDKTQVLLIEKNDNRESNAWRIDDIKGVRRDDNLFAKYISGVYGAKPRI